MPKSKKTLLVRRTIFTLLLLGSMIQNVVGVPTHLELYHRPLTRFLRTYVVEERIYEGDRERVVTGVRYGALKEDPEWPKYIESLDKVDSVWLRTAEWEDRVAFWINAYNAFVLDTVVKNYPLPQSGGIVSIRNIPHAWEIKHSLGGQKYSLTDIEEILNGLGDGRVWFLVCPAAKGGPNLRPYALSTSNILQELESACGGFCNDPRGVRLDTASNTLILSAYFEEHAHSFTRPVRTYLPELSTYDLPLRAVVDTIVRRLPQPERDYILSKHPEIKFSDFDWRLNEAY